MTNKVRSSCNTAPPEWDYTSSKITVYHRTNVIQITTDDGHSEWEYDEEQISFDEFKNTLYGKQLEKLNMLNGKCSASIYYGVDIGTLHYNFTTTTQTNLETIARRIDSGTTQALYRADNESEQRFYTATEIRVVINTKDEWIAINTNYYEFLKKWVEKETDTTILETIHYGSALPSDLMTELVTRLSGVGIDVTKYAKMLS